MKTHCTNYNNVYALVGEHQQKKPPFRVAFLLSVETELVVVFSQNFLYLFRFNAAEKSFDFNTKGTAIFDSPFSILHD